jgi:predicted acyl esterase
VQALLEPFNGELFSLQDRPRYSYHFYRQVAALRPPHLSGILVQDGYTDLYRELAYKGGVFHPNFMSILDDVYRAHGNDVGMPVLHLAKACDIEAITCPMYIICSLADNGLHTPGTIRGWLAAASDIKYLELHP